MAVRYCNRNLDKVRQEIPIKKRIQNIFYNKEQDEYWITTEKKPHVFYPLALKTTPKEWIGTAIYDMDFDQMGNVAVALIYVVHIQTEEGTTSIKVIKE